MTAAAKPPPDVASVRVPPEVAHPKTIRSFVRRAGRTTAGQSRALQDMGPRYLVPYEASLAPLAALYPQLAALAAPIAQPAGPACASTAPTSNRASAHPLVLEIGFGMGEASAQIATLLRQTDFLCCEVHEPGVGALLKRIAELGLTNIRIVAHDAVEVIERMLPVWDAAQPERGLDGVHIFFPDPWHKTRHHKRRLIQSAFVQRLAARLKPGAYLHCATDWEPYAQQMLEVLTAEPALANPALLAHPELAGYAPRPHYRPLTKFERRGVRLGHGVWDLVFQRV